MPFLPPPTLRVDTLTFAAKIDYAKFTNGGIKIALPTLSGRTEWTYPKGKPHDLILTIHDPTPNDLRAIRDAYGNPMLLELEVAVDVAPREFTTEAVHAATLDELYLAVAARFRPEEKALWDYGVRGALSGRDQKPEPLERRFPTPNEEVIYGHRSEYMQAKMYLKTLDQGVILPVPEHRVRMEITLKLWACKLFSLRNAADLLGYPYRAKFATHFRIIDRPEVRAARGLTEEEFKKRTRRMERAWGTAGVGKFAVGDRPREDALIQMVTKVRARERAQLPADHYKLMRDQVVNARIGNALMGLQRRMRAK